MRKWPHQPVLKSGKCFCALSSEKSAKTLSFSIYLVWRSKCIKPLLQCSRSSSPSTAVTAVNFNISCREIQWHICPGMSCDLTTVFFSSHTQKIHIFEAFKDKWGREQMYIPKCGYNLVWQIWENSPVPLKQSIFREQEKYKILFPRQPARKHQYSIAKLTSLQDRT